MTPRIARNTPFASQYKCMVWH